MIGNFALYFGMATAFVTTSKYHEYHLQPLLGAVARFAGYIQIPSGTGKERKFFQLSDPETPPHVF